MAWPGTLRTFCKAIIIVIMSPDATSSSLASCAPEPQREGQPIPTPPAERWGAEAAAAQPVSTNKRPNPELPAPQGEEGMDLCLVPTAHQPFPSQTFQRKDGLHFSGAVGRVKSDPRSALSTTRTQTRSEPRPTQSLTRGCTESPVCWHSSSGNGCRAPRRWAAACPLWPQCSPVQEASSETRDHRTGHPPAGKGPAGQKSHKHDPNRGRH